MKVKNIDFLEFIELLVKEYGFKEGKEFSLEDLLGDKIGSLTKTSQTLFEDDYFLITSNKEEDVEVVEYERGFVIRPLGRRFRGVITVSSGDSQTTVKQTKLKRLEYFVVLPFENNEFVLYVFKHIPSKVYKMYTVAVIDGVPLPSVIDGFYLAHNGFLFIHPDLANEEKLKKLTYVGSKNNVDYYVSSLFFDLRKNLVLVPSFSVPNEFEFVNKSSTKEKGIVEAYVDSYRLENDKMVYIQDVGKRPVFGLTVTVGGIFLTVSKSEGLFYYEIGKNDSHQSEQVELKINKGNKPIIVTSRRTIVDGLFSTRRLFNVQFKEFKLSFTKLEVREYDDDGLTVLGFTSTNESPLFVNLGDGGTITNGFFPTVPVVSLTYTLENDKIQKVEVTFPLRNSIIKPQFSLGNAIYVVSGTWELDGKIRKDFDDKIKVVEDVFLF